MFIWEGDIDCYLIELSCNFTMSSYVKLERRVGDRACKTFLHQFGLLMNQFLKAKIHTLFSTVRLQTTEKL